MKARRYTKKIEFWQVQETPDGYGGNTITPELIAKSWCNIKTPSNHTLQLLSDIGINDPTNTIVITLRHRNDITYNAINQFIKYNGVKYIIKNNPTNIDLEDVEVTIIATKEQTNNITVIDPINV